MESRPFNDDLDRHEVIVVKDGVAYFNSGIREETHLPVNGDIYTSFINCRQRTNSDGVYVPAPNDKEWMVLREGSQPQKSNWPGMSPLIRK